MRCPSCRQPLTDPRSKHRPFCSERCRLVDLSKWLDGSYAIPGEPATDEELAADLQDDGAPDRRRRRPSHDA